MNSHKSRLCCGNSISTGKPCRNYVVTGYFCRYHQDQISGKNKYGVPITQKIASNCKIELSENNYCNGTTAKSQPCKMRVKSNNLCHLHKSKNIENNKFKENDFLKERPKVKLIRKSAASDIDNQNVTHQCDGITTNGNRCRNKFKHQGKFCHKHNESTEELNNDLFVPGRAKRIYYSIDG